MKDFEAYAARERLESYRANAARKLTRQQRAQRRRFYRRTSAVFLILLLCLCSALWGMAAAKAIDGPQETRETVPMETPVEAESAAPAPAIEPEEDFENEKIEDALLNRSHKLTDVTVTHYCPCQKCCGKPEGHPAYGITASGRQLVPGVSVGVDPSVIPLGSTVILDFGDGDLQYCVADDTGSGVKGKHIDLAMADHQEALEMGVRTATVYWCEEGAA